VRRLQRVLSSLLGRCLKHSMAQQKIGVELRYPLTGKARLRLWDTGSGSSTQDLHTLSKSSREQAEQRLAAGGAPNIDLGAVCDIVRAHGGELKVETEMGAGTTYLIYLPVRRRDRLSGYSGAFSTENVPLLLAGVEEAEHELLLVEATKRKICLSEAETGAHAIAMARTYHFPLVVLGSKLPDRARVLEAIRSQRPEDSQVICEIRSAGNGTPRVNGKDQDAVLIWNSLAANTADCGAMLDAMLQIIGTRRTSPRLTIHEPEKGREIEDHPRR